MEFLSQRNMFATVNREEDLLSSQVTLLGTGQEASVRIMADVRDFIIVQADFEISRTNGIAPGQGTVPELYGLTAGFEDGGFIAGLSKLAGHPAYPMLQPLFIECIHGYTQAETYVITQRGFAGEQEYEDYWWQREQGGCLFYSSPRSDEKEGWFGHLGPYRRNANLFNRNRHVSLDRQGGLIFARGFLDDSYHTMAAAMTYEETSGIILESRIEPLRVPASACKEMASFGGRFTGLCAYDIARKQIKAAVGGGSGCFHLSGLMSDLFRLIQETKETENQK